MVSQTAKPGSILKPLLKIGELAKQTQTSVATLRCYEKLGLVSPTQRAKTGYRYYANETIRQVLFIQKAQMLGFSLKEIQEIVTPHAIVKPGRSQASTYNRLKQLMAQKVEDLAQEITCLSEFKVSLERYRDRPDAQTSLESYSLGLCELIQQVNLPTFQRAQQSA
jgi:DNA-binding transcriptional MerR regulator